MVIVEKKPQTGWTVQIATIPNLGDKLVKPCIKLVINSELDKEAAKELGELLIDLSNKL